MTCVSASDCWAVGYLWPGSTYQTLIEQWDGSAWAIVASPNTSSTHTNVLQGVTCVSAADCWAVGYSADAQGYTNRVRLDSRDSNESPATRDRVCGIA